jgi:hypothetical protein
MEDGLSLVFWLFASSLFRMLCQGLLHRFKLIVKLDLSDASLHVINTFQRTTHNFDYTSFESYRICEDTLVSFWEYVLPGTYQCGLYTGLTSARFADVISHDGPATRMLLSDVGYNFRLFSCSASGRFVVLDKSNNIFDLDLYY